MTDRYTPTDFETKWQNRWREADLFRTRDESDREKFYGLDFFPFPSGAGLSVGHCRNYVPTDVICRQKYMEGRNVLHCMGFDAFGLPAENEAIKRGRHPSEMIDEYAGNYRRQMDLIGISYDWSRTFSSSDPDYYRWTQWIFKRLFERGLAYRKTADVNWCPKDKTALANEEVVGGLCERCGTPVVKKAIPQWYFKITEYAQQLLDGLETLNWPEGIKAMQRNWIGRSEGVEFDLKLVESKPSESSGEFVLGELETVSTTPSFRVFTTRIDTVFGMTFCVLSPEHPLLDKVLPNVEAGIRDKVIAYREQAQALSENARSATNREKTGVFSGLYAKHPCTGESIPIFVADYVLMGYGTGAIMAVPAHDQRDFDFAIAHDLPVLPVIEPDAVYFAENGVLPDASFDDNLKHYQANPKAYSTVFAASSGRTMNSGEYSVLPCDEAKSKLAEWFEACHIGERKVNYRLRDWLISRQRFWGCPIPVTYSKEGDIELVADSSLPVLLPDVPSYSPTDDGSSPLAAIPEFVNAADNDGSLVRRETDTLGGFACSSWYFLRFCDPYNSSAPWDPKLAEKWMPVDCYVGGAEHAVMHLLYARFWMRVFYDMGLVPCPEPFQTLRNQGQVLGNTPYRQPRDGEVLDIGEDGILISYDEAASIQPESITWRWMRMSKSKGNVVTPDEAVREYGADALRLFELFVAPFEQEVQWQNDGINGMVRFLNRIFRITSEIKPLYNENWKNEVSATQGDHAADIRRATHTLIHKATEDINSFAFNTYVSAMMIFVNTITDLLKQADLGSETVKNALSEAAEALILVMAPAAPHSADELWEKVLGRSGFTYEQPWPKFRAELIVTSQVTVAVQVNGKLRETVEVSPDASQEQVLELAQSQPKVQAQLDGKTIRKVIYVQGKLLNIVAH